MSPVTYDCNYNFVIEYHYDDPSTPMHYTLGCDHFNCLSSTVELVITNGKRATAPWHQLVMDLVNP